jgi:hypothetical protein
MGHQIRVVERVLVPVLGRIHSAVTNHVVRGLIRATVRVLGQKAWLPHDLVWVYLTLELRRLLAEDTLVVGLVTYHLGNAHLLSGQHGLAIIGKTRLVV